MTTIEDLKAILDSDDALEIQILPDGSIEAVPVGTPPVQGQRPRILTLAEFLGEDY